MTTMVIGWLSTGSLMALPEAAATPLNLIVPLTCADVGVMDTEVVAVGVLIV